jgi:CO/xanthine dehydrogenase FAD-binding subunit
MEVLLPRSLDEALALNAERPEAVPIAGGMDVMVEINFGRLRPEAILDLTAVPELREWRVEDGHIMLGAGVTYSRVIRELPELVPLVQASRSVGSPQIRNRGTVGGNLGTASPAGDALPVLAAYDAEILVRGRMGSRTLPWDRFLRGPKKTALASTELILGARWPRIRGAGTFSKVGTRNAMVISVVGLCLVMDEDHHRVRVALGSAAPTIVRAPEAEALIEEELGKAGTWDDPAAPLGDSAQQDFAERVAAAARPIDDVRSTASYRRHAVKVLAARSLSWVLADRKLRKWS